MKRRWARGGQQGFALLAALLITTIALLATATLAAVTLSSTSIAADDQASVRAADTAEAGVTDALERLRWGWLSCKPSCLPVTLAPVAFGGGSYSVTVAALSATDPAPRLDPSSPVSPADPGVAVCRIDATGTWGQARRTLHVVVLSTPDGLPRGVVVGGDAMLAAPVRLLGCGLYAGGDVSGREWVTAAALGGTSAATPAPAQSAPPASAEPVQTAPPDLAYGGLYQAAAVHAVGRIFARGAEEHAAGDAPPADSDDDRGVPPPAELVAASGPALLGALAAHASDPGAALGSSGLDLALLERVLPTAAEPSSPAGGRIYVAHGAGGPLDLFGDWPPAPQACPVTLVVLGDCVTTDGPDGASPPALCGCLIVTGTLTVQAPLSIRGSVYAGGLEVRAPLEVDFTDTSAAASIAGQARVRGVSWRD